MATVYGRIAKISNVVGRSNYLNDEKRQEKNRIAKNRNAILMAGTFFF